MKKNSRKRSRSHHTLESLVKGMDDTAPEPSPAGLQKVKEWVEEQLEELEVAITCVEIFLTFILLILDYLSVT